MSTEKTIDKHQARKQPAQYAKATCPQCGATFQRWVEYGKRRECCGCRRMTCLVGNEWIEDGQGRLF